MNIIFNDSNINIGGIEVLFLEMTKHLIKNGHNVYYLVGNLKSVYERNLSNTDKVYFIRKSKSKPVELYSNKDLKLEKEFILSQLPHNEDFYVISPYYQSLQYAIAIFGDKDRFKLIHLWSHPQSWANSLGLKKENSIIKRKRKNRKYYYQKDLLLELSHLKADYYSARVVPIFNSWFYDIDLNPQIIETLPIEDIEESSKKSHTINSINSMSVLWCGRFAYFKNEAIIHIHKTLEELAKKYPEITFSYGIIGFGNVENTNYIKNNIKTENVDIKFYGKVDPNKLIDIFHAYDIGIGMGLTVKKMGQVGLPSIVIDTFEPGVPHIKNANWLFDTSEGDAGDGYYFRIAEKIIPNRKELFDLLNEVVNEPEGLEVYSNKCIQFVKENYSFDKQFQAILTTAQETKFHAKSYPIYRRNIFARYFLSLGYYFYRKIKVLRMSE